MGEQLVPRCNLWGVINPQSQVIEWRHVRCDRPLGHRGPCYAKRRYPTPDRIAEVRFAGQPQPKV